MICARIYTLTYEHRPDKSLWDEAYKEIVTVSASGELATIARPLRQEINHQIIPSNKAREGSANPSFEWRICNEVLQLAVEKQSQIHSDLRDPHSKSSLRLNQIYGNIAEWVQKFVQIGDVIAQVDPVHVGLPWAAVRFILLVRSLTYEVTYLCIISDRAASTVGST